MGLRLPEGWRADGSIRAKPRAGVVVRQSVKLIVGLSWVNRVVCLRRVGAYLLTGVQFVCIRSPVRRRQRVAAGAVAGTRIRPPGTRARPLRVMHRVHGACVVASPDMTPHP